MIGMMMIGKMIGKMMKERKERKGRKSRSWASTCSGISPIGNNEDVSHKLVNHPKTVIRWKYDLFSGIT